MYSDVIGALAKPISEVKMPLSSPIRSPALTGNSVAKVSMPVLVGISEALVCAVIWVRRSWTPAITLLRLLASVGVPHAVWSSAMSLAQHVVQASNWLIRVLFAM